MPPGEAEGAKDAKGGGAAQGAASQLVDVVAKHPALQDNAEAAGWYIAGLLRLAEEAGAEAHSSGSKEADADADGRGAAAPPWPPPPSSDKAASTEHCARVLRWCVEAHNRPSSLSPGIASRLYWHASANAAAAACVVLESPLKQQPGRQVFYPLLTSLVRACWSTKRPCALVAAVGAFACATHCTSACSGTPTWHQACSFTSRLITQLPAATASLSDEHLAALLRAVHRMLLAHPYPVLEALLRDGVLLEQSRAVVANFSQRSQLARTAALHLIATVWIRTAAFPSLRAKLMQLKWPGVAAQCCCLVGKDLGAYTRGDREANFATWADLTRHIDLVGMHLADGRRELQMRGELSAAAALVRLLGVCLATVPTAGWDDDDDGDSSPVPAVELSQGHLRCLHACLDAMGSLSDFMLQELLDAGAGEALHAAMRRQLPARLLEDVCLLMGGLLLRCTPAMARQRALGEACNTVMFLLEDHFKRACEPESDIYGAPLLVFAASCKLTPHFLMRLSWFSHMEDMLVKYGSRPTCSTPTLWYGLASLCYLSERDTGVMKYGLESVFDRSPLAQLYVVALKTIVSWMTTEQEPRPLNPLGEPEWEQEAENLLDAMVFACKQSQQVTQKLVEAGMLEPAVREVSRAAFINLCGTYSACALLMSLMDLLRLGLTADEGQLRRYRKDTRLALSLWKGVEFLNATLQVQIQAGEEELEPPPNARSLLSLLGLLWGSGTDKLDNPGIPSRAQLIQTLVPLIVLLWDSTLQTDDIVGSRALIRAFRSCLMGMNLIPDEQPLPPKAFELLCKSLQLEVEWGKSHFSTHSDHCWSCMEKWSDSMYELLELVAYCFIRPHLCPLLAAVQLPQELERASVVIRRHQASEPWAASLLYRLKISAAEIRGVAKAPLRAAALQAAVRNAEKRAGAESAADSAQDLAAAEAAARAAEAALLAELEQEEAEGRKQGTAQQGAAQQGKGKKKKKAKAKKPQPKPAKPAAPPSEESEGEQEAAAVAAGSSGAGSEAAPAAEPVESAKAGEDEAQPAVAAGSRRDRDGDSGSVRTAAGRNAEAAPAGVSEEARRGYERMLRMLAEQEKAQASQPSVAGPTRQAPAGRGRGRGRGRGGRVQGPGSPAPARELEPARLARGPEQPLQHSQQPRNGEAGGTQPSPVKGRYAPPLRPTAPRQPPVPPGGRGHTAASRRAAANGSIAAGPGGAGQLPAEEEVLPWLALPMVGPAGQQAQQAQHSAGASGAARVAAGAPATVPAPAVPAAPPAGGSLLGLLEVLLPREASQAAPASGQHGRSNGAGAQPPPALAAVQQPARLPPVRDSAADVPGLWETLCCPLTKAPFQEPVITPWGHTFERAAILDHLRRHSVCPLTGRHLAPAGLRPNHAVREAVEALLGA